MGKKSKALVAAEEAEQQAAEHRDTPEKKRARLDELQERARLFGDSIKQSYNAKCLERKWLRFLLVHGDDIGWKAKSKPTIKQVERFIYVEARAVCVSVILLAVTCKN